MAGTAVSVFIEPDAAAQARLHTILRFAAGTTGAAGTPSSYNWDFGVLEYRR